MDLITILFSRKLAAHALSISVKQLDRLRRDGQIAAKSIGQSVLFHREELERFARELNSVTLPPQTAGANDAELCLSA